LKKAGNTRAASSQFLQGTSFNATRKTLTAEPKNIDDTSIKL